MGPQILQSSVVCLSGTIIPAAVTVPGESFSLQVTSSMGSFTLEDSCALYFSFPYVMALQ